MNHSFNEWYCVRHPIFNFQFFYFFLNKEKKILFFASSPG